VDRARLEAKGVEEDCEEADGDVEDLAGDFVAVDLNLLARLSDVRVACQLTNDLHFWWMGMRPSGLGLLLISRQ
jgi:hypothetical protein